MIRIVKGVLFALLIAGCSAKQAAQDAIAPFSKVVPTPGQKEEFSGCTNFSGRYQMDKLVDIRQTKCEKQVWTDLNKPNNPAITYIADGVVRTVDGYATKAYFQDKSFVLELAQAPGKKALIVEFAITNAPCGENPAKDNYLTQTTYFDGQKQGCKAYLQQKQGDL